MTGDAEGGGPDHDLSTGRPARPESAGHPVPGSRPRHGRTRGRARLGRRLASLLIAGLLGAVAAIATLGLSPSTHARLGPGEVELRGELARDGRTRLGLPPLGRISAQTHDSPLAIEVRVDELDLDSVQEVLGQDDPEGELRAQVSQDLEPLLRSFAVRCLLTSLAVGAVVGVVLPRRRWSWIAASVVGAGLATSALLGFTWSTFDEAAFDSPRFEGSLERAPEVLRTVQRHIDGFDDIRSRVDVLALQVGRLYSAAAAAPAPASDGTAILHVSDLHLNPLGIEIVARLARQFRVAGVIDTGDVTSFGLPIESRIGDLIAEVNVPYYLAPGNHDASEVREALRAVPNVRVLDGNVVDIGGVRVLGVADPTFTADNRVSASEAADEKRRRAPEVARLVEAQRPDVLAVHDPILAERAAGRVPLVVAGHVHRRTSERRDGTLYLTVGSTGATGLGSFTVLGDLAYEAQVLHFAGSRLVAIDYVSLRGIEGNFRIDRTIVAPP